MKVNIYNTGNIPWLNINGPVYGMDIGDSVYRLLARDSRVDIELTYEAERRAAAQAAKFAAEQNATVEKQAEIPSEPVKTEKSEYQIMLEKAQEEERQIQAKINGETPSQVLEKVEEEKLEEEVIEEETITEIEEAPVIDEAETQDTVEDTYDEPVVDEADEVDSVIDSFIDREVETFDVNLENIAPLEEVAPVKKYTKKALEGMTKEQMKEILRERGYTDGEYAPRYHDTVQKLINKVLATQK